MAGFEANIYLKGFDVGDRSEKDKGNRDGVWLFCNWEVIFIFKKIIYPYF